MDFRRPPYQCRYQYNQTYRLPRSVHLMWYCVMKRVCVSKRMPAMVSRGNSGRSNQTKRIKSYALTRADSTKPQVQQSSCPSDPPSILSPRASSPSSLALLLIFLLRRPHLYPLRMTCSWNKTQSPSRSTRSDHRCPSPSDNR